jgi:hypothetical protein
MNFKFRKDEELSSKEKSELSYKRSKADATYDNEVAAKKDQQDKLDAFYSGSSKSTANPFAKQSINKSQFIPSKRIPGTVTRFSDTKLDWNF